MEKKFSTRTGRLHAGNNKLTIGFKFQNSYLNKFMKSVQKVVNTIVLWAVSTFAILVGILLMLALIWGALD
jgi:cytochrome c-type biogenesis protein CcmH/NrfF